MLHFLWLEDPHNVQSRLLQLRFTRLVFGLCPSPAILGSVISHHLDKYQSQYDPGLIQSIKNSFYVDDLISGGDTIQEAFNMYMVAKQAMIEGGFNLRKRNSNSQELLTRITASDHPEINPVKDSHDKDQITSQPIVGTNLQETVQSKLLGIV